MSGHGMTSISAAMATVLLSCVSTQALPQAPPPGIQRAQSSPRAKPSLLVGSTS